MDTLEQTVFCSENVGTGEDFNDELCIEDDEDYITALDSNSDCNAGWDDEASEIGYLATCQISFYPGSDSDWPNSDDDSLFTLLASPEREHIWTPTNHRDFPFNISHSRLGMPRGGWCVPVQYRAVEDDTENWLEYEDSLNDEDIVLDCFSPDGPLSPRYRPRILLASPENDHHSQSPTNNWSYPSNLFPVPIHYETEGGDIMESYFDYDSDWLEEEDYNSDEDDIIFEIPISVLNSRRTLESDPSPQIAPRYCSPAA